MIKNNNTGKKNRIIIINYNINYYYLKKNKDINIDIILKMAYYNLLFLSTKMIIFR